MSQPMQITSKCNVQILHSSLCQSISCQKHQSMISKESMMNFLLFLEEIKEQDQPIPCRFSDALSNFKTVKMREAFFRKNCNYIPPEEVVLGQSLIRKKGTLQHVNECGYIVPFQKSLENYLNQPEVWAEVTQNRGQKDIMEDFCDGTYSSKIQYFNNIQMPSKFS